MRRVPGELPVERDRNIVPRLIDLPVRTDLEIGLSEVLELQGHEIIRGVARCGALDAREVDVRDGQGLILDLTVSIGPRVLNAWCAEPVPLRPEDLRARAIRVVVDASTDRDRS